MRHLLPDPDAAALQQALQALLPGLVVEQVAQIGSTSSELLERAHRAPSGPPCLLVARRQTQGRGRQGKAWLSSPGASLTFSLALPLAPADWSGLSLAVGLALADALDPPQSGLPARLGIKWPNDLLLVDAAPGQASRADPDAPPSPRQAGAPGRKIGGILIETVPGQARRTAVVGVGLNVLPLQATPEQVAALPWGHADLQQLIPGIDAARALARVAVPLLRALLHFERTGFAPLRAAFARRDLLAGQAVRSSLADGPQGIADGVDATGALWLRDGGHRTAVRSGEISLRPATDGGRRG